MIITDLTTVKPRIKKFVDKGEKKHLKNGSGQIISGFIFNRKELNSLIKEDPKDHIFMALGLTEEDPHLTVYLFRHIDGVEGSINLKKTVAPDQILLNKRVVTDGPFIVIKENDDAPLAKAKVDLIETCEEKSIAPFILAEKEFLGASIGRPITPKRLKDASRIYHEMQEDQPFLKKKKSGSGTEKVKGFHLERNDIEALHLDGAITSENKDDQFAVLVIIRNHNLLSNGTSVRLEKPYISLVVSKVNDHLNLLLDVQREYCLPCPSACNNYAELLA